MRGANEPRERVCDRGSSEVMSLEWDARRNQFAKETEED